MSAPITYTALIYVGDMSLSRNCKDSLSALSHESYPTGFKGYEFQDVISEQDKSSFLNKFEDPRLPYSLLTNSKGEIVAEMVGWRGVMDHLRWIKDGIKASRR